MTPPDDAPSQNDNHWSDYWRNKDACDTGMVFARKHPTPQAAWDACERGDWLLWWLGKTMGSPWSDSRRHFAGCCAEIAALAPVCPDEYELARQWAIDALSRWSRGEAEREEVEAAANAAYAADAAAYAANAAYAADAAYTAAYAAYAAYAADAAAYAAYAADAARQRILNEAAEIVREWFPKAPECPR